MGSRNLLNRIVFCCTRDIYTITIQEMSVHIRNTEDFFLFVTETEIVYTKKNTFGMRQTLSIQTIPFEKLTFRSMKHVFNTCIQWLKR